MQGGRCRAPGSLLLLFVLWLSAVLPASAAGTPPTPLLWRVSDADNHVYLLGTFHFLTPGDYPLDARVYAALDQADLVLLELPPETLEDPHLARRLERAGTLRPEARSLRQRLDAPGWEAAVALARAAGIEPARFERMEPWYAAMVLTLAEMAKAGLDPDLGMDRHLAREAVRRGKRVRGLETLEDQIDLFRGMKPSVQLAHLRDVLGRAHELRAEVAWLHGQWRQGDEDALYWGMAAAMRARDPAFYARINTQRNAVWVSRIKSILDGPEAEDALVAVGALHLVGAEGLVQQLAAAGYRVERL